MYEHINFFPIFYKVLPCLWYVYIVFVYFSERAKQTEATGDRFEESKNINKSLMTLGNVIKGLCDKAMKKRSGASTS